MEYILIIFLLLSGLITIYLILRRIVVNWFKNTIYLEKIKQEIEKMLVELNATTASNIDLIENRVKEVRELLNLVDKRIALLKREAEKHELAKGVYNSLAKKANIIFTNEKENDLPALSIQDKVLNLYQAGFSVSAIASRVGKSVGEIELIISLAAKD